MPEEITLVIGSITIYLIGIVTGMYAASQIEKDINKRITKKK
jgi:hypothetical protein|tara:strand:+ start:175 stop:300 length:126 start_codon:yes stop_codon:yes gene_type:complete